MCIHVNGDIWANVSPLLQIDVFCPICMLNHREFFGITTPDVYSQRFYLHLLHLQLFRVDT